MTECWGIVPAAGVGRRMNTPRPKQYLKIADKHIIEYSIAPLLQCSLINKVVVALSKEDTHWRNLPIKDEPRIAVCEGGENRARSVRNALVRLKTDSEVDDEDWVVVHDAVRPCLSTDELESLIKATWDEPAGAISAIAIHDSIKRVQRTDDGMYVADTLQRGDLRVRAATPQIFRYRLLCDALDNALADELNIEDEASAMQHAGHRVKVVLGDYRNIKITDTSDLENVRRYLCENR